MIPGLLLATVLSAQSPDFTARIDIAPLDAQYSTTVVVEVETKVPLVQAEELRLDVGSSFRFLSVETGAGIFCMQGPETRVTCNLVPLEAGGKARVTMRAYPSHVTNTHSVIATVIWRERGFRAEHRTWQRELIQFAHEFVVTHGGDSGPGSLRQAIEDAQRQCLSSAAPCRIRFDFEGMVQPRTQLPEIGGAWVVIDGESKIAIDGSLLEVPANGLVISGNQSFVLVRDLAIQNFAENGIQVADAQRARIESSVITGNRSRGIVTTGNGYLTVSDSVISGNGRSGVFLDGGTVSVARNLIGVAPDGVTPMPNGASGIFASRKVFAAGIVDNTIAHNHHFGVAVSPENRDIDVGRNRIAGNRAGQIDVGLDGPSFFELPPAPSFEFRPPNGPTLLSARYDEATGTTTVTGRLEGVSFTAYYVTYDIQFFATTAANNADDYLGAVNVTKPDFTVTFRGDLRGRFITANTIRWASLDITDRTTSELANAIEVH